MRAFKCGTKPEVKDFGGLARHNFSSDFTIIGRTPDQITVRDGDDRIFDLRVMRSRRTEWAFHSPALMITPPE